MGAMLDALQRLQEIERKLNKFREKEESIRRQIRAAARQIAKSVAEGKSHADEVTRCQMEIDNADLDIKSREQSMDKHRQALNAAKSNKEYAAILTALNTEKADTAKCESRVLELMARKEELLAKSSEFDQHRKQLEGRRDRHEGELKAYLAEVHDDIAQLEREREDAAAALPVATLQSFERVAANYEGEAMAEVLRISSRGDEHICDGCNMSVPLETVNRLKSRDEMVLCQTCGRILYVNQTAVGT